MKIFLGVCITMIAFAANSILNRMALASGYIDPVSYAMIRVASGTIVLLMILLVRGLVREALQIPDLKAVAGLGAYMLGFSFAYLSLDAGVGALILFGAVQITMFLGAILKGQKPNKMQWLGALIAFFGLAYLLLPSEFSPDITGIGLMTIAGVGWGIYSLRGQLTQDSILSTASNFLWCLPITAIMCFVFSEINITNQGLILAILSGAITSALGYTLWYKLLPKLNTVTASVSQLTVPIIAMVAGIIFLSEKFTMSLFISSVLVLGGVGLSVMSGVKSEQ